MNIPRNLEPVDLMVAAGIVATVLGALLVFVSTHGSFQPAVADDVATLQAHDVIQTALGQTVLNISLLQREKSEETTKAVKKLNHATATAQALRNSSEQRINTLVERVDNVQVEKTARAEFVKGRSIVNFTSRVIKNDSMPPEQREEYNRRMIDVAGKAGQKIEHEFQQTDQSYLGWLVVAETQRQIEATHQSQEQVGAAIVTVTLVEDKYKEALEAEQDQLELLVYASTRATS